MGEDGGIHAPRHQQVVEALAPRLCPRSAPEIAQGGDAVVGGGLKDENLALTGALQGRARDILRPDRRACPPAFGPVPSRCRSGILPLRLAKDLRHHRGPARASPPLFDEKDRST